MASRLVLRQSPLSCNVVLCLQRKMALARSYSCSSPASPPGGSSPPADRAANYSPPAAPCNDPPADSATSAPAAPGLDPPTVEPPAAPRPGDSPHTGQAPPVGPNHRYPGFYKPTHPGRDP
ncbi:hypothetical protein EJB05_41384 [Eragrostis curvula]|uniref:Uncharacterized protein n=1 Tax=Eragrostis curvula TaxID=38414 RepID=A0A5J9T9K6_9POAL|nr:hypothetical protein EJB05_41384 [Eragrostis curvula]